MLALFVNYDAKFAPNIIKLVLNSTKKIHFRHTCRILVQIRYPEIDGTKINNYKQIIEAEPLSYEKGSTYKDKVCLLEITLYNTYRVILHISKHNEQPINPPFTL